MQYRTLGRTGIEVSAVSLGTEHLLDEMAAGRDQVVGRAIEQGINYFDTFYGHPGFRDRLGNVLAGRRQQVHLAAHLGAVCEPDGQYRRTHDAREAEPFFHDYLTRVRTDYVDVLMLHNVNGTAELDGLFAPGGLLEVAKRFQAEGKVRCIGLSGHSTLANRLAVESGEIDVLMAPVNLACQGVAGFKELMAACVAHQVGVVAMKPYGGGSLLRQRGVVAVDDYALGRIDTSGGPNRFSYSEAITPVQCLAYVLSQPAVACAVPGCKNLAELEAALAYLDASEAERDLDALLPAFAEPPVGQCVYCNHCLPCPVAIDIGLVSRLVDTFSPAFQARYDAMPVKASACTRCGACVKRCPFAVDVLAIIDRAVELYE